MDQRRQGVCRVTIQKYVELHQLGILETYHMIIK